MQQSLVGVKPACVSLRCAGVQQPGEASCESASQGKTTYLYTTALMTVGAVANRRSMRETLNCRSISVSTFSSKAAVTTPWAACMALLARRSCQIGEETAVSFPGLPACYEDHLAEAWVMITRKHIRCQNTLARTHIMGFVQGRGSDRVRQGDW